MGRRGKHAAPRPRSRIWIPIAGTLAAFAVVAGIALAVPSPFASAGSVPSASSTAAPAEKDWAAGPAKVYVAQATTPETVAIPADGSGSGFVSPLCPDGSVRGEVDADGVVNACEGPAAGHPGG